MRIRLTTRALASLMLFGGAAVFILSYVVGVLSPVGQRVETLILNAAQFSTEPPAPLGLVSPAFIGLGLIVISVLAWIMYGPLKPIVLVVIAAATIGASQLFKDLLDRPQHEVDMFVNSFPSGHMSIYIALSLTLVAAVPTRLQTTVAIIGTVVVGVVSWQLLYYGWHRPSDIIGSLSLALVVFALGLLVVPSIASAPQLRAPLQRRRGHGRLVILTLTVIGASGLALALIVLTVGLVRETPVVSLFAAQVSCAAAVLLSFALTLMVMRVREPKSRAAVSKKK